MNTQTKQIQDLQCQIIHLAKKIKNQRHFMSQKKLSSYEKMVVKNQNLLSQLETARKTMALADYQSQKILILQEMVDIYNDIYCLSNR